MPSAYTSQVPKTKPAKLRTAIPGPRSRALAARARCAESPGTAPPQDAPPIFWQRARGANVWDADGNRFVDLVAGFGVANIGHAHPRVSKAIARQSRTLLHAMSEWQPAALKVELLEKLCALFPNASAAPAQRRSAEPGDPALCDDAASSTARVQKRSTEPSGDAACDDAASSAARVRRHSTEPSGDAACDDAASSAARVRRHSTEPSGDAVCDDAASSAARVRRCSAEASGDAVCDPARPQAARALLACSGSDAVEAALKTALLATGRAGVIAFEGAYHGLALGALDLTWREDFRAPFRARLAGRTGFARYGEVDDLDRAAKNAGAEIGAVIVEPVLGRGGMTPAPRGFLRALRERCDAEGWLLVADEIYSGCGRSGRWFACEHEAVTPDLLCVGKGLASGMPLAAVIGRAEVMDAWPAQTAEAEAIHTQTFLGHPASCAAALATLAVLEEERLVARAAALGARALDWLRAHAGKTPRIKALRGRGLMLGVECDSAETAAAACARALARGVIVSRAGVGGCVLALTPPLCIEENILRAALTEVLACIR